jgi:hypothetical protein
VIAASRPRDAEAAQVLRLQLLDQQALRGRGVEVPRRPRPSVDTAGRQRLARRARAARSGAAAAARRRRPLRAPPPSTLKRPDDSSSHAMPYVSLTRHNAASSVCVRVVEQRVIGRRARRDDAHNFAPDRPLVDTDFSDLLGDRRRLAGLQQPRQVLLSARGAARRP